MCALTRCGTPLVYYHGDQISEWGPWVPVERRRLLGYVATGVIMATSARSTVTCLRQSSPICRNATSHNSATPSQSRNRPPFPSGFPQAKSPHGCAGQSPFGASLVPALMGPIESGGGWGGDEPLANRVRSGRKQP